MARYTRIMTFFDDRHTLLALGITGPAQRHFRQKAGVDFVNNVEQARQRARATLVPADPAFAKVWQSYAAFRTRYRAWKGLGYTD